MARKRKRDARFDLRGGVNTEFAEDLLDASELRRATNGRLANGVIAKRTGSRRMHTVALPAQVDGMVLWEPTAGQRQLVAVANGGLHHKPDAGPTFSVGAVAAFTAGTPARFAVARVGGNPRLFIAAGGLRMWDGATSPLLSSEPPDAVDVALYKGRLYVVSRNSKTLYGSQVSDPTKFGIGQGGIEEDVETFDSEPLVGICTCGGSLILAKENSIARLTGVSTRDIRVDRNTEGISSEVGCIARGTLIELERAFFFMSDRGPYLGNESSVESIGLKVGAEFDFANRAAWANAVATHHRGRHEVWLTAPLPNGSTNQVLWIYDYRNKKWDGPWLIEAASLARYERVNGKEAVMRGGYDGWIREEDVPNLYRDDVLRDGSGGTAIQLEATYPQLMFGDPGREKSMHGITQKVQANIEPGGVLLAQWYSELGSGQVVIPSLGYGLRDYPFKWKARGKRISVRFSSLDSRYAEIGGAVFEAALTSRTHKAPSANAGAEQSGVPLSVVVLPATFGLGPNEVIQLEALGIDVNGVEVPLGAVTWESSDPTKATVSSTGVVTRVAAGAVTITASVGAVQGFAVGIMT